MRNPIEASKSFLQELASTNSILVHAFTAARRKKIPLPDVLKFAMADESLFVGVPAVVHLFKIGWATGHTTEDLARAARAIGIPEPDIERATKELERTDKIQLKKSAAAVRMPLLLEICERLEAGESPGV